LPRPAITSSISATVGSCGFSGVLVAVFCGAGGDVVLASGVALGGAEDEAAVDGPAAGEPEESPVTAVIRLDGSRESDAETTTVARTAQETAPSAIQIARCSKMLGRARWLFARRPGGRSSADPSDGCSPVPSASPPWGLLANRIVLRGP
jgi:hypothetical protein